MEFDWNLIMEWVRGAIISFNCQCGLGLSFEDMQDVCGSTLVKIVEHADDYNPELASQKTWVSRISRNCCLDFVRARSGRTLSYDDAIGSDDYSPIYYGSPENEYIERERTEWLDRNKQTLQPRELTALEMYMDGMKSAQIAVEMNITSNAVSQLLFKAKNKLKSMAIAA